MTKDRQSGLGLGEEEFYREKRRGSDRNHYKTKNNNKQTKKLTKKPTHTKRERERERERTRYLVCTLTDANEICRLAGLRVWV